MMRIVTDSGTLGHVIKMGAMHLLAYSYSGLFKWAIYTLYHKKTMIIVFFLKKKKKQVSGLLGETAYSRSGEGNKKVSLEVIKILRIMSKELRSQLKDVLIGQKWNKLYINEDENCDGT